MQKTPELKGTTMGLMIGTAIFFDATQWVMAFIFMDWLISIFAFLTFFVWFTLQKISFSTPKRGATAITGSILEMFPMFALIPAWTAMVSIIILDVKSKSLINSVVGNIQPKKKHSEDLPKAA